MKLMTIIGARPQFVKAAAVSREIRKRSSLQEVIVHTGQHFDENMSDIFFREMAIPAPDHRLNVHGLGHGAMTGQMLEKIEVVIQKENPDYLLVYGDTNTTLAGALAAVKLHKKVAHVEAGLRSFNMQMPEEINRVLTDRISDILFCPTEAAVNNLQLEGFSRFGSMVHKTGDVMQDAAIFYSKISEKTSSIIDRLRLKQETFVLCTIHRAENTDTKENFVNLFESLNRISRETRVIFPIHPRTKKVMDDSSISTSVQLIDPVGYFDMIELLKHCAIVLTDSGGLQKEAFFFKKPCVTLRKETEWVELVDNGCNVVVGTDPKKICDEYEKMRAKKINFELDLYGSGKASERIVDILEK